MLERSYLENNLFKQLGNDLDRDEKEDEDDENAGQTDGSDEKALVDEGCLPELFNHVMIPPKSLNSDATSGQQRDQGDDQATGNDRPELSCYIGADRLHQDEIVRIFRFGDFLDHPC